MSLLMLMLARAFAPLAARGALIDGARVDGPLVDSVSCTERRTQSSVDARETFLVRAPRKADARVCTTRAICDCESLAV